MFIPLGYMNIQFRMVNTVAGQEALTAIGIQADPSVFTGPDEIALFLESVFPVWEDNLAPFISDIWDGDRIVGQFPIELDGPIINFDVPFPTGGSATDDACPPNVASILTKKTFTAGRHGTGRMFLPSPTEGGVDDQGNFSTTQYDALNGAATQFLSDLRDLDGVVDVVLFHDDPELIPSPLTHLNLERKVGTQRRRLRG